MVAAGNVSIEKPARDAEQRGCHYVGNIQKFVSVKSLPEFLAGLGEKHGVAVDKVKINPVALANCMPDPPVHPLHRPEVLCKPPAVPLCLVCLGIGDVDTRFSLL